MTLHKKLRNIKEPLPILEDKESQFILKLHGQGTKQIKIRELFKEEFNLDIAPILVKNICSHTDNQVYVERYREEYLSKVKSVPLANKRIRLDDLQEIRDALFSAVSTLDMQDSEQRKDILAIYGKLKDILSSAREEMEGKPWLIQQINITELNHLSDDELHKRKEILIAKATGTYQERDIGIREDSQGTEESLDEQSPQVPLASPIGLQRIEL